MFKAVVVDPLSKRSTLGAFLGQKVPEFNFQVAGDPNDPVIKYFSDDDLLNRVNEYRLINFFASWCSTCLQDHKELMKLRDVNNLEMVGVIWKDSYKSASNWLNINSNPYDLLLLDSKGRSRKPFKLIGVPESFLLDKNNVVIAHYRGPVNAEKIIAMVSGKY